MNNCVNAWARNCPPYMAMPLTVSAGARAALNEALGTLLFTRVGHVNLVHVQAALFGNNRE